MDVTTPIPQPKTYGPLGNLPLINPEEPTLSMMKLANEQGPIYRLERPGGSVVVVSGHEYVAEVCDEARFDKSIGGALEKVRAFAGDGLFTARTDEPNWQKAHRILMPNFSMRAMQGYHPMMVDIAVQLIQKWARLNPDESVEVPEDMTRLTLDTIGLCGFNYRFNSFYREQSHPFITSMVRALNEAMNQLQRLPVKDKMMILTKRQFKHDILSMFALVDKIISERKANEELDADDLLSHMLNSKDPQTGEGLDEENIRYQIITFLIAGHETTSGLLSFAIYFLLKHPDKLRKAYEEVDRVLTSSVPTYKQVLELTYIRMVLNEALRLWPTAPAFSLYAKEDTILGGTYTLQKDDRVAVLIPQLHRDKRVWGDDVEEFRPERFADPSKIPQHAFKPFGNGQRACIGQQFALHEATLVLGMVLKHFELIDHTNYQLKIKQTLTLKPDGFTMRVRPRQNVTLTGWETEEHAAPDDQSFQTQMNSPIVTAHHTPLFVLFGSNMGTAEGIARGLADSARYLGFQSEVASLDEYVGKLPKTGVLLIVCASYNGRPPANARKFVRWLEDAEPEDIKGIQYAVFGCGDRNWAATFQKIPRFIDEQLFANGGTRLTPLGEGDASGDFEKQLKEWRSQLGRDVIRALNLQVQADLQEEHSSLSVQFVSGLIGTPLAETFHALPALVTQNRELQLAGSDRSTRHIELALPDGLTYKEGDHIGVLAENQPVVIKRVLQRFGLNGSDHILLSGSGRNTAHLPLGRPITIQELLRHSVELQESATRTQLRELISFTECPPHKRELESLLEEDSYQAAVLRKRVTMLDLLEQYPACELPFERFLELLPSLKPRYYSISSSSRLHPERASITVQVMRGIKETGSEYHGVASTYLADRQVGETVMIFIDTPESGFALPEDANTPIILVGSRTGIAPFRGFLQARHVLKQEGKELGEAHLYYDCLDEWDKLYSEELENFAQGGIVTVRTAYSHKEDEPSRTVYDLLQEHSAEVMQLLNRGARLYVCGDGSKIAPAVEKALQHAYESIHGASLPEAKQWMDQLQEQGRYVRDIWSGI